MISFNNSTLYISLRSPFARRVRVAFLENKISFQENVIDVFKPPQDYFKVNPLGRVPALVLQTGETIIDSNAIISGLYAACPKSALLPPTEVDQMRVLKWSGTGVGLSENVVQYFLETLRPNEKQDDGALGDYAQNFKNVLEVFEKMMSGRTYISDHSFSQADIDMGTALDYLKLRFTPGFFDSYSATVNYLAMLNDRPSFKATMPPPPQ